MRRIHIMLLLLVCVGLVWSTVGCRHDKDTIRVGGKDFAEQSILAEILAQLIEAKTDLDVDVRANLGGTLVCHSALKGGSLDVYVEYTGTGLRETLPAEDINIDVDSSDAQAVYQAVKKQYAEHLDLVWLKPLGFENSYVMTMRSKDARQAGLETLSDLAAFDGLSELQPAFTHEFVERKDGYPAVVETYEFRFSKEPKLLEPGMMYRNLANENVDIISAFGTDGLIEALDLVVLEDDQGAFVPYDAAPVIRRQTLDAHPELAGVINELAGRLTVEKMRALNLKVTREQDPMKESDVAREFLIAEGLIDG